MSNSIFPNVPGLSWPVKRSPGFQTRTQTSISGKEVRIAEWSYPRWKWTLQFEFLRQGSLSGLTYSEWINFVTFFEELYGGWDSFLYFDQDDNNVTMQLIGTGNGVQTVFQLVRSLGGFDEPILAPILASGSYGQPSVFVSPPQVYISGTLQLSSGYSITPWGISNSNGPGNLIFSTAPSSGNVQVTFSYFWPCRFDNDQMDFEKFMMSLYNLKEIKFTSIK